MAKLRSCVGVTVLPGELSNCLIDFDDRNHHLGTWANWQLWGTLIMKIENSFTVDAPIEEAWELLTNIAEIAPCLPGAKLTGEEDGVYSGGVKVKVGPVTSEYKGSAHFVEKDDATYKAVIDGKGRDVRGAGNAQALITAQMTAEGPRTRVDIETDLKVSGKVAQFGRGVMQDVSAKLLGQFATCLESKIGEPAAVDGIAAASADAAEADAAQEAASADTNALDDGSGSSADGDDDAAAGVAEAADTGSGAGAAAKAAGVAAAAGAGAMAAKVAGGSSDAGGAADRAAGTGSGVGGDDDADDDEEVLDLLDVAGGAVFKRLIPVAIVAVIALIIIVYLVTR